MVVALSEARSENHERIQRSWMSRVEPEEGLEPTTYCLQNSYSTTELLRHKVICLCRLLYKNNWPAMKFCER